MSQVKNLRAMFENKGDTSPPDRGRSSGASTPVQGSGTGNSGTESPVRPLSKVRTSFVAIEKDGRIGLRRDPSHESSVSRRRLSMDTDAESVSTIPDKPSASLEDAPRASKPFFQEAIPESPRHPIDPPKTPTEQMGAVTDEPSVNPDKKEDAEEPSPSLLPAEPVAVEPAAASPKKENKPPAAPAGLNGQAKIEDTKEPKEPKQTAPIAIAKASAPKKTTTTRPSTISISTKAPNTKPPAKSPSATRPTPSTTHKHEPKPAPKAASAPKKETKPAPRTTPTATRPSAASATKKPQPLKPTPSDTPFVKPKPKSPTKPVHLPASLMAPTASSGAKTGRQVQPSASSQNLSVPARPASRASATGAGASTGKTVKRQPSNVGRSRPSLGPPPKKASDPAHPKKEAPVDESFLARMMRPTQASAQKTSEKVPTTPPKKTAKRPTSSGADATRRESSMKTPGSAKKPARKPAGPKSVTGSVASDEASKVEPVVEEKSHEPVKSESPEVPQIKTEVPQTNDAPHDLKKPEPEPVVENAPIEVEEPIQEETQAQDDPKESSKEEQEKKEEVHPITPETPKEEEPVDVPETTATEELIASPKKTPADEIEESREQELTAESQKPIENDVIVPLVEEGSTQPPVVVEETKEASTTVPEPETTDKAIPLLEKDAESTETETAEKKDNETDTTNKNDTKEDEKTAEAVEDKDTTGERIDKEQKEDEERVTKTE
ncbi:uncharacterized protein BKA55DRAFT_533104 [Fusarium redolens]|uniref:Uncharacterized protein n=1 Tax=Fusarium redolens TaxID=48865 RepID=A0A9P9KXR6_FUSRE|nr:uncharacterized protein BKA55DRAFT_533104 [Fusarium redolens]KAH7270509.1 hypothetical protein BKA55DRAFT_533104 [Fusarium redolens]